MSSLVGAALRVEVTGVEGALRDNVLALITVQRERGNPGLSEGHVRRYVQRGPKEIRQALEPFGYYAVQVETQFQAEKHGWTVRYRITPGEPVRLTRIDVRLTGAGESDADLRAVRDKLALKAGAPARHADYESAKAHLQRRAVERGYLDAHYTRHELRIDPPTHSAEIFLHLDTGPRYRFGPVTFDDSVLDEGLLRRYVTFKPDEPYTSQRLLDLQRALEDSGYFATVDVQPRREQAQDHAVPVQVALEPRKRHLYKAGLGFGTDTGARGLIGWEHRRINRYGHRMNAELRASEILQSFSTTYSLPLAKPSSDRLEFTGVALDEQSDTVDTSLYKLGVGRSVARGSWREALTLGYHHEDFKLGLTHETTSLLIPGVSYKHVSADNRLIARRGHALQIDLQGAAEPILSDTSFGQAAIKAKLIHPLGRRGRVVARAEGGATWTQDFDLLPASLRYFAGGDQSVRGYDYQELGPRDASGEVIGGKNLVFGSLEYEHRLFGNWGVAVFVDTGNAFNRVSEGLETGAGLGLRWESPIGMVRLDLASAVSQDNALRLHFTLGPDL